jgi:gliding motility-associated-like protein
MKSVQFKIAFVYFLIKVLFVSHALAQGEANVWYFGFHCGLDFNTTPPTPLTNGLLQTYEGCASIADKNGALVFYTDGTTVWDKSQTPMPNGTGLFGNSSSTQSAIIVPYPGTYNYGTKKYDKYYIVTVDYESGSHGVCYSEVDMTLRGGLGDVTATKNIHLYDNLTTEKICVAQHSNNCDFWVIGKPLNSINYYAYPVTSAGFNTTPVVSPAGPSMDHLFGSLKVSFDNKTVVATHSGNPNGVWVYDFNNTTGVLSLKFSDASPGGYTYSQEFSPNNKILYVTALNNPNIYQYDLTVANNAAFVASRQIVGTTANTTGYMMCALQIAPNGKIYAALQQVSSLGIINNPNTLGAGCGYVDMAQSLAGKTEWLGLPAIVTSLIRPVNKIVVNDSCEKRVVHFGLLDTNKITSYNWNFATLAAPNTSIGTSSVYNPTMQFNTADNYLVTAINHYACFIDTIIDTLRILPLPNVTHIYSNVTCFGLNNGTITITASGTTAPYTYAWSNLSTTAAITSLAPAKYVVTVTDIKGCSSKDSSIIISPSAALSISATVINSVKCFGDASGNATVTAIGGTSPYSYSWNTSPIQTTQQAIALTQGSYTCTVTDSNLCTTAQSVLITQPPKLVTHITNYLSICKGTNGDLNSTATGGTGTYTYNWQPSGSTTSTINVAPNATTKYILTITDSNSCVAKDSSTVIINPNPVVNFVLTPVCVGDTSLFMDSTTIASGHINSYNWTFGVGSAGSTQQNPKYLYANCNNYTVGLTTISDSGCTAFNTKLLAIYCSPIAAFNVNNVCSVQSAMFSNTSSGATSYTWDFDYSTGVDDTAASPSHNYSAGNHTVQLIATSGHGCIDSVNHTLVVYPQPTADFRPDSVCLNLFSDFTNLSTVGVPDNIVSWQWDFENNGSIDDTSQTPSKQYPLASTYTTYLKVTTNHGCEDTATKNVIVYPLPIVKFSSSNVCDGTTVPFNDSSSIAVPSALQSWKWNFGDSNVNTNQNTSHLYLTANAYTVKLIVTSNVGCKDSITKVVTVNPNPIVAFSVSDTIGCEPLCVHYSDNSSIAGTGINVGSLWDYGDGNTGTDPNYCYKNDSVFSAEHYTVSLKVTSDSGCVSTGIKNNYITVYPKPTASFTAQPQSAEITNPVVSIMDLSTGANFWNWNFGDQDTTSAQNPPPHTYADTGSYQITLITSTLYSCKDTADQQIIINPVSLFFIPSAFSPNDDGVNDTFSGVGIFIKQYEMSIFDRWGNLIFSSDDINKPWDGKANHGSDIAQQDVYVYSIKITDIKMVKHNYRGVVTLVR